MVDKTYIVEIIDSLLENTHKENYFKNDTSKTNPELSKILKTYYDYLKEKMIVTQKKKLLDTYIFYGSSVIAISLSVAFIVWICCVAELMKELHHFSIFRYS